MSRVIRWTVPVDDQWHEVWIAGQVLHVASRQIDEVEIWVIDDEHGTHVKRQFRVFGTGHDLPDGVTHVGTALAAGGALVWHLFELGVTE